MALPGFTAEASVGPTTQVYRVLDRYGTAEAASVYGQQLNGWGEGLGDQDFGGEGLLEGMGGLEDLDEAELAELMG